MNILVVSGKGGTGKTTISSSLSILLSETLDIVAVDADADTPNLHLILDAKFYDEIPVYREKAFAMENAGPCKCPFGAIEKVGNRYIVNERRCEGCGYCLELCKGYKMKSVVSGFVKIGEAKYGFPIVSSFLRPGFSGSGDIVDLSIRKGMEMGENLLIDAPAGIGCPVISSFKYADVALFVLEPTKQSKLAFERLLKLSNHFGITWYVILNKSNLNEKIRFPNTVLEIPYDPKISEAISNLIPPVLLSKRLRKGLKDVLELLLNGN